MGFGHRVYKNYDPRAKVMQKQCHAVLDELGLHETPLLKVALELERIALQDEYFIEKKLYPNIDFYSGITLRALGFPVEHVHRAVRAGAHRRLDRAVEGDAGRPAPEDRPAAADLYRRQAAQLRADREAVGLKAKGGFREPAFGAKLRQAEGIRARGNRSAPLLFLGLRRAGVPHPAAARRWAGLIAGPLRSDARETASLTLYVSASVSIHLSAARRPPFARLHCR